MTHIPVDFDSVQEATPAPAGRYEVQITEAQVAKTGPNSKVPGSPQYRVSLALPLDLNAPNITHFISLPNDQDEPKSRDYKILLLKRFLVAFNIPFGSDGFDLEEMAMQMVGSTAVLEVALSEPDDNGNVYNRLQIPKIPSEGGRR